MTEGARSARADDQAVIAALVDRARLDASAQRGGELLIAGTGAVDPDRPGPKADLVAWAAGLSSRVLLCGVLDDVVVGVAAGHLTDGNRRLGVVDCCYVEPDARQVGVGTALVGALLAWFEERGCSEVDALALPGDRQSKQLLEAAGFSARLLVLHRRLR